jgi:2'-5' RNA ligase
VPPSLVGAPVAGRWRVGRVSLVRSELRSSGARYTEVAGRDLDEGP